jgi:hypothetical protein
MAGPRPLLIFWQQILPGDRRKMVAQAADSSSGGGARDLRFPDSAFRPIFERMFPELVAGRRPVRRGHLVWEDEQGRHEHAVEYWPPTDARPGEGRLARIHNMERLRNPPDSADAELLLILILDDAHELRAYYTTSTGLQAGWHDDVAKPILDCLRDKRRSRKAARGWLDLTDGRTYCHGA